jgi:transposase
MTEPLDHEHSFDSALSFLASWRDERKLGDRELSRAERNALAVDFLYAGYSPEVVAKACSVHLATVYRATEIAVFRTANRQVSAAARDEAVARVKAGERQNKVASDLGVHPSTVSGWVRESKSAITLGRSDWHWKRRRFNAERIVTELAITLEGLASTVALADANTLQPETARGLADSIAASLQTLQRFRKDLTHVVYAGQTTSGEQPSEEDRPCISPAVGSDLRDAGVG